MATIKKGSLLPSGNHYELLQIPMSATQEEVRKAYLQKALMWHPDKNDAETATANFQLLYAAYNDLSDINRREAYDMKIGTSYRIRLADETYENENEIILHKTTFYEWPHSPKSFWDTYLGPGWENRQPAAPTNNCDEDVKDDDQKEEEENGCDNEVDEDDDSHMASGASYLGYKPWSTRS